MQYSDVLPEGWTLTQLSNVVVSQKGKKPKILVDSPADGFIPYIDIEAFEIGNIRRYADIASSSLTDVPDLLIVWDGARCGLVGKSKQAGAIGSTLSALCVFKCEPDYLLWFLRSQYQNINGNERGIGIPHIQPEYLWRLEVPVPPLAEQKRIVAQVETLLASVNATRERLAKVPAILKRFRQSVLAAACSGRLTEDWRAQQKGLEPASCLLERIREERRTVSGSKYKEPVTADVSDLPTIPDEWLWATLDQVSQVGLGGTPSRKLMSFWNGSIPWISSGEVANCRINKTRECITGEGLTNSNAKLYPSGTVLIAMIGEGKTRGQSAILDIEACTNQNVAALVFDTKNINSEYVWRWALSEYEHNRSGGRGGMQPALNAQKVRGFCLPVPSLEEQQEIVRRVEALFRLADAMEKRIETARRRADKLTQTILARAFRGELVPTEAELARQEGREYETAAALLERIQAERADTKLVKTKPARKPQQTMEM